MSGFAQSVPKRAVLVIDGTGRGHTICDLFTRTDPNVLVYYGPGCDAIQSPRIIPVPSIELEVPATALAFLADHQVEFVFVSNIDALSKGYADVLRAHGHRTIGPSKDAAELEASKQRGKRFCLDHGLPTAVHRSFTDPGEAAAYARALPYPCVVKVDGLCKNGDGSVVCDSVDQAVMAIDMLASRLGEAFRVIVEERIYGPEISIFALLDGDGYLMFPTAMDFKRTLEGERGVNCDGMGSVAPHPLHTPKLNAKIRDTLLDPLMRGLASEGLLFTGFIYIGAMITERGLRVIEINARFGDSEAEVVLPSVHSNFMQLCETVLDRRVAAEHLVCDGFVRCSVALTQGSLSPDDPASPPGWPFGEFQVGQEISGLDQVNRDDDATLFYANLRMGPRGVPVTTGGRVLHVVGKGCIFSDARECAYQQLARISFPGMRYRTDIGDMIREVGWAGRVGAQPAVRELCHLADSAVRKEATTQAAVESLLYSFVAGEISRTQAELSIARFLRASEAEVVALGAVLETFRPHSLARVEEERNGVH